MNRGVGGAVLAVVLAMVLVAPATAQEGGATCAGQPVTIHYLDPGVGDNIAGTNGPDVIQGGPRAETINAGPGEDIVCGGGGGDTINGGTARDELLGQDGSDQFTGADLGQDVITGGSQAEDGAYYTLLRAGVQVDMTNGLVHMTGAPVNGGILGVEVLRGSGFADVLVGSVRDDLILGRAGDDTIDGRGGEDAMDGGGGADRLTYQASGSAVTIDLPNDVATVGGDRETIANFERATGSPFADRLLGGDDSDQLAGGGGDDVLKGRFGDDVLEGGGGDDTIFPSHGDDYVDGGSNDPVTSTGEHGDLVSYQGDVLPAGVTRLEVGLYHFVPTNSPPYAEGIGADELVGIESARGVKNGKNHIQGNDGPNVIIGGDGQDFLNARGGNDLVFGLSGVDILNGDYGGGENPGIFGNDYVDGGAPTGNATQDRDSVHGNGGDDTCTGAVPDGDNMDTCETIF